METRTKESCVDGRIPLRAGNDVSSIEVDFQSFWRTIPVNTNVLDITKAMFGKGSRQYA